METTTEPSGAGGVVSFMELLHFGLAGAVPLSPGDLGGFELLEVFFGFYPGVSCVCRGDVDQDACGEFFPGAFVRVLGEGCFDKMLCWWGRCFMLCFNWLGFVPLLRRGIFYEVSTCLVNFGPLFFLGLRCFSVVGLVATRGDSSSYRGFDVER